MSTARYYDEAKNEDGTQHIWGVPMRDLSDDEYDALPKWVQAQVDASPMYRKTNPNPEPKAANKTPPAEKAAGAEEK